MSVGKDGPFRVWGGKFPKTERRAEWAKKKSTVVLQRQTGVRQVGNRSQTHIGTKEGKKSRYPEPVKISGGPALFF